MIAVATAAPQRAGSDAGRDDVIIARLLPEQGPKAVKGNLVFDQTLGGFFQRLERGTYMAHVLEHVTLELQTLAGSQCGFGRARELEEDGVYKVAIQYEEESLARHCLETGRRLVLAPAHKIAAA